jgi:hypothetical protein
MWQTMANSLGNVSPIVQSMRKHKQSGIGVVAMSEETPPNNLSISNINKMRMNFFDVRRILKLLRDVADNASWFTIRHAEVALMLFDQVPEHGMEQQLVHKICGLNQSTTHRILESFVKLGWITIEIDTSDKRLRRIKITKEPIIEGVLSGEQVITLLLEAGSPRDQGALLQKNFETRLLQAHNVIQLVPQDIAMEAKVGKVKVVTGSASTTVKSSAKAKAIVLEYWEHDKAIDEAGRGTIERRMDRADGRWSIYRKGIEDPIGIQKNMVEAELKEIIEDITEALANAIRVDGIDLKEPLENILGGWAKKLNRDEYQLLRQKLMVNMAAEADKLQQQAKETQMAAAMAKESADRAMAERERTAFMHQEQMFHGLAARSMQEWAALEKTLEKQLTAKDKFNTTMSLIYKQQQRWEAAMKDGTYVDVTTEVEEDDDA